MLNLKSWQFYLFTTLFLLGIMFTIQFRTQQNFLNDLKLQETEDLVVVLKNLHDKRGELETELQELNKQSQLFERNVSESEVLAENLHQEIKHSEIVLGLTTVEGPGISITIADNPPIIYLDLVDILNELWASGAEAIAINDQRVTSWTKINWDKNTLNLTVNNQEITYPCTIKAIGNPSDVESGLRLLGGVLDDLATYKIYPVIKAEEKIEIPTTSPPILNYLSQEEDGA